MVGGVAADSETWPASARSVPSLLAVIGSSSHQFHPAPHSADHGPRLDRLVSPAGDPVLDLGQGVEPGDAHLGLDLEIDQLLRQRGDDVGQGEAPRRLERVDRCEAARNVCRLEQRRHDVLDGVWRRCRDAVVYRLRRNPFSLYLALGYLGRILGPQRGA
ncbi:hypothetical protein XA68_12068 [Ophiocordyceps unilateralis]|uniref:Uncharacterized protein n=1 Tax=Ophiocordyceps unilateralis TaxID=268505 RepID=A0A2A9PFE2_OPHUN|nr:hypothetical protein XA68_12068 [Ophiocordyceps unilateralis]